MRLLSSFGLGVCGVGLMLSAVAQGDCSDAAILGVKGGWTKHSGPGGYNKDQVAINRFLDSVGRIFQTFYPEPKGMQARWYPSVSSSGSIVPGGPTVYTFNSQYFCWYCNVHVHKLMLGDETGTDVDVSVNSLGLLLGDQVIRSEIFVDGSPMYVLPDKVGVWKGYELYALPARGPTARYVVLARGGAGGAGGSGGGADARNGVMPWKPVTQEQYLKAVRVFIVAEQKKAAGP